MAVNTAVYGSEDKWSALFTSTTIKEESIPRQAGFLASNGTYNSLLQTAFLSGVLTINAPIDNSIAFVGTDNGSWLTDRKWVANGKVGDEYVTDYEVCKLKKKNVNPLAYFSTPSAGTNNDLPYVSNPYTSFWGYDQTYVSGSANMSVRPYTYISVKDMVYVAMVRVIDKDPETLLYSDTYTTRTFDLYTYFKYVYTDGKHIYEYYPYVISLFLVPIYSLKTPSSNTYRSATNSSSIGSAKPNIMNDFETGVYPYDNSGKPLKILTYLQSGHSYNDSSFRCVKPFSNPTGGITEYGVSYNPVYIAGIRNVWGSYSKTTNQMFCLYSNIKSKSYLDNNTWRVARWLTKVDDTNSEDIYDEYMKQCAYLGAFFTDSYDYAEKAPTWDYDRCCIGIIDDNGVTHGEYSVGEKNREQKQWEWESWKDTPFKPSVKPDAPDKEQSSDPFVFSGGNLHGLASGNYYAITQTELNNLQNWISKVVNPSGQFYDPNVIEPPANLYNPESLSYAIERMFNGVYPNDCIINLQFFPFDILKSSGATTAVPMSIKLGNTETRQIENWYGNDTINGAFAVNLGQYQGVTQYVVLDTNDYSIEEYFGDFRDYQPYTTMELLIPWHGTLTLDPSHWYGHNLSTKMVVDLITGTSTTYILRDGIATQSIDGQVGYTINFSIRNVGDFSKSAIATSQQMNMQKYDNAKTAINAVTGTVTGIATGVGATMAGDTAKAVGGVAGALGGIANGIISLEQGQMRYKNLEFALGHCPSGSTLVSAQCPAVSQYANEDLRLIIKRPHLISGYNSSIYGKTVGFACNIQDKISSFSGFTQFSGANIDGITATEQEKQTIYASLQQGVII